MTTSDSSPPEFYEIRPRHWMLSLYVFAIVVLSLATYQTYGQTVAVNALQQELRQLVKDMSEAERKLVEATTLSNDAIEATGEQMAELRTTLDNDYDDVKQSYLAICQGIGGE